MQESDYTALCQSYLAEHVNFRQRNNNDLLMRIAKAATSLAYAKNNPEFRLKKTIRSRAPYWCCYAGPDIPIYDFLNGTVLLTDETNCYVLSGSRGEKYIVSLVTLSKLFRFDSSEFITPAALRNYPRGMWFKVTPLSGESTDLALTLAPVWAISIPAELEFSVVVDDLDTRAGNMRGVDHACGDLLLVGDGNGRPDFSKLGLINGAVFADCFSKRNFPGYFPYMRFRGFSTPAPLRLDCA